MKTSVQSYTDQPDPPSGALPLATKRPTVAPPHRHPITTIKHRRKTRTSVQFYTDQPITEDHLHGSHSSLRMVSFEDNSEHTVLANHSPANIVDTFDATSAFEYPQSLRKSKSAVLARVKEAASIAAAGEQRDSEAASSTHTSTATSSAAL
jgi:hypothetical protein